MKTIEELEREAYIKGDVEKAKLYAQVVDLQREVYMLEDELEDLDYE
jgi:hypothetical protein